MAESKEVKETEVKEVKKTDVSVSAVTSVYIVSQKFEDDYKILGVFSDRTKMLKEFPNFKQKDNDCDTNGNGYLVLREKIR